MKAGNFLALAFCAWAMLFGFAATAAAAEMFSVTFKEVYAKDGKWGLRLTLKNNYKNKDIIGFSELKGEYLRDGNRNTFRYPEYTLKKPIPPGKSTAFNMEMPNKTNPAEISGVKIFSVNHATRQAAPPPARAAAPAKKAPAKTAAPAAGVTFRATAVEERNDGTNNAGTTVTFEVLNNSATQPLVRLDNVTATFTGWRANIYNERAVNMRVDCGTKVVNIPPLGTTKITYFLRTYMITGNLKLQATPRFGVAQQKNNDTTIIIRK